MNKAKLKSYAPNARKDFIQMIRQRADLLGLTKGEVAPAKIEGDFAVIEGRPHPKSYAQYHQKVAEKIRVEGLESFIERIAYSWFNRFAALRFMEINGFLSHGFRVLSNSDASKNEPEILRHAAEIELAGVDKAKVIELKLAGNKDAELYKILLIAQCNELHRAMPFMFERVGDETEMLLPDNLLASDSVIRKLVAAIDETDWAEVEIIGWLYQFYISERKDEVIGKTVKSEDIPAATQLFTPNWIVKYMTQNSLGRLWLEANPHSQLAANMEFYISQGTSDEGQGKSEENQTLVPRPSSLSPEDIKVLDPACGSGHILVEAYELLKAIYTERGYSSRDIPLLILEKNLFGADIDERAAQMANFALLMKARRDDRRIFERLNEKSEKQIPNILTVPDSSHIEARGIAEMFFSRDEQSSGAVPIRESNFLFGEMETQPSLMIESKETVHEIHEKTRNKSENSFRDFSVIRGQSSSAEGVSEQNVIDLLELFERGKTLGSLIRIPHGFGAVIDRLEKAVAAKRTEGNVYEQVAARELEPFVRAAQMLTNKYDCVIANPPYMGGKGMNAELKAFAAKNFPDSKSDLFAMFIERNIELTKKDGFLGFMTPFVWMFLSSYEKLRSRLLSSETITSLVRPEYHAFFESAYVPICSFVLFNGQSKAKGSFYDLTNFYGADVQPIKLLEAITNPNCGWRFQASSDDIKKIAGSPIAYWVSDKMREVFEKGTELGEIAEPRQGLATADNNRFLRYWFEPSNNNIGVGLKDKFEAQESKRKWFPYNKGGEFRKWFGNNEYVVNWENDGFEIKNFSDESGYIRSRAQNTQFFFKPSITWTFISSSSFGVRRSDAGFVFDVGGSSAFPKIEMLNVLTGFLCSSIAFDSMKSMNPTLNFQVGNVASLPLLEKEVEQIKPQVDEIVEEAVAIARADWDSFETSWDFSSLPLIQLRMTNDELRIEETDLTGNAENTRQTAENKQATAQFKTPPAENNLPPAQFNLPPAQFNLSPAENNLPPARFNLPPAKNNLAPAENNLAPAQFNLPPAPFIQAPAEHSVEAAWNKWKSLCDYRIARMQKLETENNRLFIEAYGLQEELSPEVPLSQITLARADSEKDTRRLLSYFIGCLMGRYSLDEQGLIYADANNKGFDNLRYRTFAADDDGIVPVTDIEWFEQDAARQFEKFVAVAFKESIYETHEETRNRTEENLVSFRAVSGQSSHEKNMKWIAEQLGAKASETPLETIRRYFSTAFFKDHLQTYKKRPIYWLFSSGKQKAFECLVYLHRYNESTLPRMRHEYVLPLMSKLTAQIETTESLIEQAASTSERTKLQKQLETFRKKQTELAHFDEKLRHYSDLRISLDLDDGVKVNYGKFGDLLAEVKQVAVVKE